MGLGILGASADIVWGTLLRLRRSGPPKQLKPRPGYRNDAQAKPALYTTGYQLPRRYRLALIRVFWWSFTGRVRARTRRLIISTKTEKPIAK